MLAKICTILPVVEPTSTDRVPPVEKVPPSRPVPEETLVTVPVVASEGIHCVPIQRKTWLAAGVMLAISRPCNLTAFTLVTRNPSTIGIWPEINCKILLPVEPTSTDRVPPVVNVPPSKPVPEETLVTVPTPEMLPALILEIKKPSALGY